MSRKRSRPPLVYRILLVCASDGVTIAADIVDNMADFVFEENPLIKVSLYMRIAANIVDNMADFVFEENPLIKVI